MHKRSTSAWLSKASCGDVDVTSFHKPTDRTHGSKSVVKWNKWKVKLVILCRQTWVVCHFIVRFVLVNPREKKETRPRKINWRRAKNSQTLYIFLEKHKCRADTVIIGTKWNGHFFYFVFFFLWTVLLFRIMIQFEKACYDAPRSVCCFGILVNVKRKMPL